MVSFTATPTHAFRVLVGCVLGRGSAGDPRGIRWGSSGDPHGFRGIRPVVVSVWPTFWGEPSEGAAVFYNIKRAMQRGR